jgi:isopenicillin-N epimerase
MNDAPAICYGHAVRDLWPLDPAINYLNHGGYGVTPREVLTEQTRWRDRIERNPTGFMVEVYPGAIRAAAAALASFIGADADGVVFAGNATEACNAVLRSLDFAPGNEILTTDVAYGAITKAIRYAASRCGAALAAATIPLPLATADDALAAIAAKLSARTRLVVIDHIVSLTGCRLPVERIATLAHAAGARVLVDGAHAPGQIALDMATIGADWYVGNCHKWLFAPRACGFLWGAPDARDIHPPVISHGYGSGMVKEFDWTGTRDPSAFLSVPAAIAFHRRIGGTGLMARNAALALEAASMLAARWGTDLAGPRDMFAAMVAVALPERFKDAVRLRNALAQAHGIETVVQAHGDRLWLRVAAQAYNELGDYEGLAAAVDMVSLD